MDAAAALDMINEIVRKEVKVYVKKEMEIREKQIDRLIEQGLIGPALQLIMGDTY